MTTETHSQLASFIWSICNLLRGPYKRDEYRKVILPLPAKPLPERACSNRRVARFWGGR